MYNIVSYYTNSMLQPLVVSNHKHSLYLHNGFQKMLDMLFYTTEVDI